MRGRFAPYLLIAPSVLFLGALFLLPLVQTIALAFQEGSAPGLGLGNFARMADDLNFQDAVRNTFRIVLIVVPLQLSLALVMALMLGHLRRGRDIVLWIWSIPLGISDLAAGLVWLALLNDRGFLNSGLFRLGLIAAGAGTASEICAAPKVTHVQEPEAELTEGLARRRALFRRL